MDVIQSIKNGYITYSEKVFIYGIITFVLLMMVGKSYHVGEYLFVGLLILWGSVKLSRRDFHFVRTPLDFPILLFLVWILALIPFSVDPAYSLTEWRKTISKILMFYFLVNVVRTEQNVRDILFAFMIGVVALSVFGIVDHVVRGNSLFDRSSHAASLAGSATWFSIYLVMGIPFLWLFFQEREGKHGWYVAISFVLITVALFLSHIRGTWVAFLAQTIVFWLITIKNIKLKLAVVAVACGLILIGGYFFVYQTNPIQYSFLSFSSLKFRLDQWQIAVEQILDQPIVGYGYGNDIFMTVNETMNETTSALRNIPVEDLHIINSWLTLAYGIGLPGLTLFALIFFIIIRTAMAGSRERKGTFVGNFGFCIPIMIVGVVTAHTFGTTFAGSLAYLFWLLTGLYFALWLRRDAGGQVSP